MPGQQQLGLQSLRRCMQLVFSPHLPQRYAYYIVSQQGIVGVPEHYSGQDVAPPAAARAPGAAGRPPQARPIVQQQQQPPAQHASKGPQQQSASRRDVAQPRQQQVPSMQGTTGAATGGMQGHQHVLQQQSAQRPHGGAQQQEVQAVPPSHPGRPTPESAQSAQVWAQSNVGVRHNHPGSSGEGTAQPPHTMLQSKQAAPSAAGSSWFQHAAQQQQPDQYLSSRAQPPPVASRMDQDASQQQLQAGPGQGAPPFGVSYNTPSRPGLQLAGDSCPHSRPQEGKICPSPDEALL